MDFDVDTFWARAKALMRQKGVTQVVTAEACGIPFFTFRGWMSKGIIPILSDAYNLAQYLGVSLEFLINGRGTDEASQVTEEVLAMLKNAGEKLKTVRRSVP